MSRASTAELQEWIPPLLLSVLVLLIGVAIAVLPWSWALLLVAAPALALVLIVRPELALCLLAFAVPFGSIWEWPLGPVNVSVTELLVVALGLSWAARMLSNRRLVVPQPPLLVPLVVLLFAFSLSILASSSLPLSVRELVKWLEVLVVYLFMAARLDRRWGKWVVLSLLSAATLEALFGVYHFLWRVGPEGFVLFGRFMRAYGHFAQPNPFAGYLGLSIPLCLGLGLWSLEMWASRRAQVGPAQPWAPWGAVGGSIYWAAFAAMLVAIVMSWSRGGWIGVGAALLVVTVARSRRALLAVLVAAVLVAVVLSAGGTDYVPSWLAERFAGLLPYVSGVDVTRVDINDANWAVIERLAHWSAAVGMFADHPWLGVGIGNYAVAYGDYALGRWRDPLGHAHNYFLNVAAEAGIVGLLAYLAFVAAAIVEAWRAVQPPFASEANAVESAYWRAVALGGLGVLVHLLVHSLFDNLYVHSMNVQVGLVLGLLAVAQRRAHDNAHRV